MKIPKLKKGIRIELLHMVDEPFPVPAGTKGTIVGFFSPGCIQVRWDEPHQDNELLLIPKLDAFRVLEPE